MTTQEPLPISNSRGERIATWWRSECPAIHGTIFYIHGGGFIFGSSDDLPADMINAFNRWGYHVLAIEYPLAPEVTIHTIIASVIDIYAWWQSHRDVLYDSDFLGQLYIMGRSAGAYLAQNLTAALISTHQPLPNGLILFYGYSHFDQPDFINPSPYYLNYPELTAKSLPPIQNKKQSTFIKPAQRIPLYIYARQQGKWLEMLGINKNALPVLDLRTYISVFPRTFLAAATQDPDVPYENTLHYHRHHPSSHLFSVQGKMHDIDQLDKKLRTELLDELQTWLRI
jgi:acetyl esterase/lipase